MSDKQIKSCVLNFKNLARLNLDIPDYQRPYVWEIAQVRTLINDIKNSAAPLLGAIILHDTATKDSKSGRNIYEIIDGQQRLTTIKLILMALNKYENFLQNASFFHQLSQQNIKANYEYIRQQILDDEFLEKLENTEFIVVATKNADDAFIFFDNTNSKGKTLAMHDLIKAFHLQSITDKKRLYKHATFFEGLCKDDLEGFLYKFLLPARLWIKSIDCNNSFNKIAFNELCRENQSKKMQGNMGVLATHKNGEHFFKYLKFYADIYFKIKKHEKFNLLWKPHSNVGNLNLFDGLVMCLSIYESKFKTLFHNDEFLKTAKLFARVIYSQKFFEKIYCPKHAKELIKEIYFASYSSEVENIFRNKAWLLYEEEVRTSAAIKKGDNNELTHYLDDFFNKEPRAEVVEHFYKDEREQDEQSK